jgi:hypothetical protein
MKESEIQRFCLDALKQLGIFCMRLNSGKVKVRGAWMNLAPVGTADIVAYPEKSLPVWLEIKQVKGEQRDAQVTFQEKVTSLGHSYYVIKSVDEVMELLPKLR